MNKEANTKGNVTYQLRLHGLLFAGICKEAKKKRTKPTSMIRHILMTSLDQINAPSEYEPHPLAFCFYLSTKKNTARSHQAIRVFLTIPEASSKQIQAIAIHLLECNGIAMPDGYETIESLDKAERSIHPSYREYVRYKKAYTQQWKQVHVNLLVAYCIDNELIEV